MVTKHRRLQRRLGLCLIAIGVLAGILTIGLAIRDHSPLEPNGVTRTDRDTVSSSPPSQAAINNFITPTDTPKYIQIKAIGVPKTRVMQLGLLKSGQIATPSNIFDTGWYNGSTKPGQAGESFIYGHVSSWKANGIFYNLKKLKAGDTVTVTRGDDSTFTYTVTGNKLYDYNNVDMKQVLTTPDNAKQGLSLMTCAGNIIKGTSEFNKRLVVFAKLTDSHIAPAKSTPSQTTKPSTTSAEPRSRAEQLHQQRKQ